MKRKTQPEQRDAKGCKPATDDLEHAENDRLDSRIKLGP